MCARYRNQSTHLCVRNCLNATITTALGKYAGNIGAVPISLVTALLTRSSARNPVTAKRRNRRREDSVVATEKPAAAAKSQRVECPPTRVSIGPICSAMLLTHSAVLWWRNLDGNRNKYLKNSFTGIGN